jgi:hypothetical protein
MPPTTVAIQIRSRSPGFLTSPKFIWLHIVYQAIVIHGWFTAYCQQMGFKGGF